MGRWHFWGEMIVAEREAYDRTIRRIDAWWDEFRGRSDDLVAFFDKQKRWDIGEWMGRHLQAVDPSIMWEYGPPVRGQGHRLVITPESAHHLRPMVTTLLERAPAIAGWEFYGYRLAEDVRMAQMTVEGRVKGDLTGVEMQVSRGERNLIDVRYLSPRVTKGNEDQVRSEALVAVESLLGEQVMNHWIGAIEVEQLPASRRARSRWFGGGNPAPEQGSFIGPGDLPSAVDRAIRDVRAGLRPEPHQIWTPDANWQLLEFDTELLANNAVDGDYAEQDDLYVAKTPHLELWDAAHGPMLFYDERFSRHGERFAYVKIDGSQGLDQDKFQDKAQIEDAIDAVLAPEKLGCQIGGGTGLRYSYIDLALTDLDKGIQVVRNRLREGNVPRRSWIQFFNADWRHEWIGMYPDSPPPPMPADD